jgi:hypothetical protein
MIPHRLTIIVAALATSLAACSGDQKAAEAASELHTDSAGGLVIAPSSPYHPTGVEASSALVVSLVGDSTTAAKPTGDCASASSGAETVFWVDGIREGKPLPNERRYQLINGACGLEPRIQATVVGGAVNVFNETGAHRLVFVRAGTTDTLQVMPFSLAGSVVATDRLTKTAGVVEVKCTKHPGEHAHIAVFDHPYFGVASSGEKITLESVPPGDYRVMTWHEGLSTPTVLSAKVGATGQTEIVVR